jgi:hypothetical protein
MRRIETEMRQHFFDPQALCRHVEGAVEYGARVQICAVHPSLVRICRWQPGTESTSFAATTYRAAACRIIFYAQH